MKRLTKLAAYLLLAATCVPGIMMLGEQWKNPEKHPEKQPVSRSVITGGESGTARDAQGKKPEFPASDLDPVLSTVVPSESWGASIVGGNDNFASGYYSCVFGGKSNVASGEYSVVIGGSHNMASIKNQVIIADDEGAILDEINPRLSKLKPYLEVGSCSFCRGGILEKVWVLQSKLETLNTEVRLCNNCLTSLNLIVKKRN